MNRGEHAVGGWFVSTRDLLSVIFGTLGLTVTIVTGMYFFFSTRDTNAAVVNDRVNTQNLRLSRLEDAIYGNDGLNAKFTDVRSQLAVLIKIASDDKKVK